MKFLFAFLIDSLKKWWGDVSSPHLLRGFLLVIWQGLRLPVAMVYRGLRALGMLALRVKLCLIGFRVSDAVRLWRKSGVKGQVSRQWSPRFLLLLLFLGSVQNAMAELDGTSFITKWRTTGANESITIQANTSWPNYYTYTYDIDCDDDGVFEKIGITENETCNFVLAGEHIINIRGIFPFIGYNSKDKILDVMQWGNIAWKSMNSAFYGARNLQISATDSPDLSNVTNMSQMFMGASFFNSDISNWNVSNVTNMSQMFYEASSFNQDLSSWNVSNITDMSRMFYEASSFNQDLSSWNVSNITDMSRMFVSAYAFNQDLSSWNVSNVTDMSSMFSGTDAFNQNIGSWNVSNVTNMSGMFNGASAFNQNLNSWNVSNVTNTSSMFSGASAFNQNIGSWDVSNVTNMSSMFSEARAFNQNLNSWNVSNVTDMSSMFSGAYAFNQYLSSWNVSNVINMSSMFYYAIAFNQDLSSWNVSNVIDMSHMFEDASVKGLSSWNVSNVTNMSYMFYLVRAFNSDLSSWDVGNVKHMYRMFYGVILSTANYDALLVGWNNLTLKPGITFYAGYSICTAGSLAETARTNMINSDNWRIYDGGCKSAQTITFTNPGNKTFGDTFTLGATTDSGLSINYTSTTTSVCTVGASTGDVTLLNLGNCSITASQAGNATYIAATDVSQIFTIAQKDITATAENKSRVYGVADPTPTFTYSDSATGIDTPPTATFSGDANSAVGSVQTISCSGGSDDKYNITSCNSGILTITQASTTTAIISDNPDPSATGNVVTVNFTIIPASGSNLTGNVTVSDGTDSCTASLPASSCNITFNGNGIKNLTATYAGDANFSTSTSSVVAHTVKLTQIITFTNPGNKTFGDTFTLGATTDSGLSISYTSTTTSVCTVGASTGDVTLLNMGSCSITASQAGNATYAAAVDVPNTFTVLPAISINNPTTTETGTIDFTVSLSHAASQAVTVDYATANNSAIAGNDYVSKTGTVTFNANTNADQTISVTINSDGIYEGTSETFYVNLTNPSSNAAIGDNQGIGTITDNESQPSVTLNSSGSPLAENGGTATITATLSNLSYQDVTANLGFSGTAIVGTDYTKSDSIVISAGNTSNTMTLTSTDDLLDEDNETIIVDISSVTNGTENGSQQQTATITDNDPSPSLSINDVTANEGNSGTSIYDFTVTLSEASGRTVTVDYATSNGTAVDSDYTTVSSTTLTFNPGDTTKTVSVTVNGDSSYESNEAFNVDLSNPSNATITDNQGIGTISNDDSQPTVAFTTANQNVTENTASATITAQLSAVSSQDVTIPFTPSGTATNGTDYTITASPMTISAGNTSADITLTLTDDNVDGPDETVIVTMGTPTNATASGTISHTATIQDDDISLVINEIDYKQPATETAEFIEIKNVSGTTINLDPYVVELYNEGSANVEIELPDVDLAAGDYYVICGNNATVANCDLDHATDTNLIQNDPQNAVALKLGTFILDAVSYAGTATNALYTEGTGASADSSSEVNVSLSRYNPDGKDTNDNSADLSLRCITPGLANDVAASSNCYQLSINDPTAVNEGNSGNSTLQFTVSLSEAAPFDISVDYATADNTATAGLDYTAITATTLTFTVGQISKTVSVTIVGDGIDEVNETLYVDLSNASTIIADNQGIGTITDDDSKGITVNPTSGLVTTESAGTATFTVKLDSQPTADVTIGLTSDNANEGTVTPSSLTFKPIGTPLWSNPQTVTLTGVDDTPPAVDGNISYNIVTAAATGGDYAGIDPSDVSITNNDNDIQGITVNPTTLNVSEPTGNDTFTIKLNTQPSADVTIASIGASNGQCSVSPTSTTIASGNWNTGTTFTVTAIDNNSIDGTQTCTISIGTSASTDGDYDNISLTDVTVTVQDDETAGIDSAEIGGSISLTEGDATGSYDIKLSSQPTGDVEITATADTQTEISSDGTTFSNSVTLTFTIGNWNTAQTITVQSIDDSNVEGSHTSTITHAITGTINDVNYPDTLSLGDITVNITDNDVAPPPPASNPSYKLTVESVGGTVTGAVDGKDIEGINCGSDCQQHFDRGTEVILTATPANTWIFDSWTGDCDSEGTVVMNSDKSCTATFIKLRTLTITTNGQGTVDDCGTECTQTHPNDETLQLSATPASNWVFESWAGDCDSEGTVVMNSDKSCTATFIKLRTLTITTKGKGTVDDCGKRCKPKYPDGETVQLSATPAKGWQFSSWTGKCDNKGSVTMSRNKACRANFTQVFTLTVTLVGKGTVTGANLDCSENCTVNYPKDTKVALTAEADVEWIFESLSGDCDSTGNVQMTSDKTCLVTCFADPNIPNNGDGNVDGIKDTQQANVVSLPDSVDGEYITLEVDETCSMDDVYTNTAEEQSDYDPNYQFPQGMMYFEIGCTETDVTVYFHALPRAQNPILQKYGPTTPGDLTTLGWFDIPNVTYGTVTIDGKSVVTATYHLIDGELGDNTGVDGRIIDPMGLAFSFE